MVAVNVLVACFQVAISAPSHYKYKQIIKFYNGVFGLSLNRHLKQTAVSRSVFLFTIFSHYLHLFFLNIVANFLNQAY